MRSEIDGYPLGATITLPLEEYRALVAENDRLRGITKGAPYEVVQALTAERDSLVAENAQLNSALAARLMAGVAVQTALDQLQHRYDALQSLSAREHDEGHCPRHNVRWIGEAGCPSCQVGPCEWCGHE